MLFNLLLLVLYVKADTTADESSDEVHFQPTLRRPVSSACSTPNDKPGTCIELRSCSTLYNLMLTRGKEPSVINFLRKSQCGITYNKAPKVCCPPYEHGSQESQTRTPTPLYQQRPNSNADSDKFECGRTIRKSTEKIVGGMNSTLGDWPWMAALGYKTTYSAKIDFKCGATLISDKWVITAAHCATNLGIYELSIARLGDLDLNPSVEDFASPIDAEIEKIIIHPQYSTTPILNDIALLKLKNKVKFSKYIRPICLLSGGEFKSDTYYIRKKPFIIGWGALMWRGATITKLQETSIPIVEPKKCAKAYTSIKNAKIDETVLCAGEPGKDTCQGDSGGPLIFPKEADKYFLGGIVSYGIRCADPNFPGVYTRIAAFIEWINQITENAF